MLNETIVVIDTETGGLDPHQHSLLTVALIVTRNLEIIASQEWKLKHEEYRTTERALEINGIDIKEHDASAMPAAEAIDDMLDFIDHHRQPNERVMLLGQNTIFDKGFLETSVEQAGCMKRYRSLVSHRYIDLMSITAFLNLTGHIRTEGLGLDAVIASLNIEKEQRHSALGDARMTLKALVDMYKRIPTPTAASLK
ncbi:3'-5' exonuclease [Exiguobacterium antarcticum]|uniref:3'-5' exonuclease n=1 Tax=Exiguobacterium antarcticum TaxID=132920 RepID=A0ABT6R020_9BACL|nr:3'-5' exonuclease [Exiguobacterium antarcticum]MDI3234190.1 3'-5' exonuclease [Exiguobacterium antarcticum]